MKFNLKNELWKTNPHDAKIAFEKELKQTLAFAENSEKIWKGEGIKPHYVDLRLANEWHGIIIEIKEILGEV